jgi:hypothetical protein
MEKSIESIWKQGFLDDKALVAPQVNDLYTRKSEHVIEKFKRMFRLNLRGIAVGGVLGPIGLTILNLPITAVAILLTLVVVYIVNKRELEKLEQVDTTCSSYEFLKAFDHWMTTQISMNARMAKTYYPFIFLGMSLGLWFSVHGPVLFSLLGGSTTDGWTLNGVPGLLLIPVALITALLWHFGDRLYHMELDALYGRVLGKLEELLADMEALRNE